MSSCLFLAGSIFNAEPRNHFAIIADALLVKRDSPDLGIKETFIALLVHNGPRKGAISFIFNGKMQAMLATSH